MLASVMEKKSAENGKSESRTAGGVYNRELRLTFVYWTVAALLITQALSTWFLYSYIVGIHNEVSELSTWFHTLRRQHESSADTSWRRARYKRQAANEDFMEDNSVPSSYGGGGGGGGGLGTTITPYREGSTEMEKGSWIMSLSKIPVDTVQTFCKQYCPAGPPGPPGPMGSPGVRGVEGPRGERGDRGYPGEPGPRGAKGDMGYPGSPGLDGRDGIPGEPGLDGVPGRNGVDGLPGADGRPGNNGIPGRNGVNGTDGRPGSQGLQGPEGPPGIRGLPGPRGKAGMPGRHGTPGIPGVNTYTVRVNGTLSNELLVPPSIADAGPFASRKPSVVEEGKNIRLRCAATGNPRPLVVWRKLNGGVISLGAWQVTSEPGHTLNITRIGRHHMGEYMCIADNGIPPPANRTFTIEVHFSPLIRIHKQLVGAANGSVARLSCDVESFPEAVRYWEGPDGRTLEGDKYKMDVSEPDGYRSRMELNITRMSAADFGIYHCVAKNEMGITKGSFTVYEVNPWLATPPPMTSGGRGGVATYGELPPDLVTEADLCPPPICPECPKPKEMRNVTELRCRDSLFDLAMNLDVRVFGNETLPGYPNRSLDCLLYAVGKPVYHRYTEDLFGSWMRDSMPSSEQYEHFWVTRTGDEHTLYEYSNKTAFKNDVYTRKIKLHYPFRGNAHIVYNGSFFYADKDAPRIIRVHLDSERVSMLEVPQGSMESADMLYSTAVNAMDFNVDDNGLWVIYGLKGLNNTVVMKLDAETLDKQYMWNISLNHHRVGEMFIVCGVLYAVDSTEDRNTHIRFALDLYKNNILDVNLPFSNPFRKTTMLGYNHRHKELYTWDRGNQLTYPIRYHEIGYNSTKEEKGEPEANAQIHTGIDVFETAKP